jgi:hypothetical protein
MFGEYVLPAALRGFDAFVSVAKMKSHKFMGLTLCLKNLFGIPPIPPHGRARNYFHHPIRLPRVLADLGRLIAPCLNVVDALVAQSGREWGGEGRVTDTLVAGDHPVATDACAAALMGTDPALDWPEPPFRRERNHVAAAAAAGFGTADLREIDFESEVPSPIGSFDSEPCAEPERIAAILRTACVQALHYRAERGAFLRRYAGLFIALQDGEVVWSGSDPSGVDLGALARKRSRRSAVWLKLADPEERERERFEVYERELERLG